MAKALSRKRPKGRKMSLREVSAAMAAQGFPTERGRPFNHKSVAAILASSFGRDAQAAPCARSWREARWRPPTPSTPHPPA
jgi:hypothetical protein